MPLFMVQPSGTLEFRISKKKAGFYPANWDDVTILPTKIENIEYSSWKVETSNLAYQGDNAC